VEVVEVDVVGAEPLQRARDRAANALRRAAPVVPTPGELRRDDDRLPAALEDASQQPLAASVVAVDLGRVEERDALIERRLDDGARLLGTDSPAEVVAADPQLRDAKATLAERHDLHAANAS
jgi:hypothetical protein